MRNGKLRHRAALYRMQETRNQYNEAVLTPVLYGWSWVSVDESTATEVEHGGRTVQQTAIVSRLHYRDDIRPRDRAVINGSTYEIASIVNTGNLNRELVLNLISVG